MTKSFTVGGAAQDVKHQASSAVVEQMLQIIQDQHHLSRAQEIQQLLDGGARVAAAGSQVEAQRFGHGKNDEVGGGHWRQVDEHNTVAEGAWLLCLLRLSCG